MSNLLRTCAAVTACVLVACGPPSSTPPTDAAEADTPVGEICNGVDDTQDGMIDEGCPCTSFDVSLPATVDQPDIVWTGDDYFVVINDVGTLTIASLADGVFGTPFDAGLVPAGFGSARGHELAWSGTTLAVVLITPTASVELAFYASDGLLLKRIVLPAEALWSRLVWGEDRFVVAGKLNGGTEGIAFSEYTSDGTLISGPTRVRYNHELHWVDSIAVSPTKYVMTIQNYMDPSAVVIDRVTHAADLHLLDIGRTNDRVSVAYRNGSFAATRAGGAVGGDGLQLLDANGTPQPVRALPWASTSVALSATRYGWAAYSLQPDTMTHYQYAAVRLEPGGYPITAPILPLALAPAGGSITAIDAATADGRFAIANGYMANTLRVIQHCDTAW